MANILLTTTGTGGDVIPFVRIGSGLSKRGHKVTLISNSCYQDMAGKAGIGFAAIDSLEESRQLIADGTMSNSPKGFLAMYRKHFLPKVRVECELIKQLFRPDETVLVARSTPSIAAIIAAETLKIPLISVFLAPSFISSMPVFEELVGSVLGNEINEIRSQMNLPTIENWSSWLKFPRSYVGLWPEWFASASEGWTTQVNLTGFVLPDTDNDCFLPAEIETVLTASQRPVLLTGGTGNFSDSKSLVACVEACKHLGLPGILITPHKEEIAECLSGGFVWCKHAPFEKLMRHIRLAIHHGGIGTLAQVLAGGVPQLIIGVGADRPDNASHLKRLGVAEYLPPAQQRPDLIVESLCRLMSAEVQQKCDAVAERLGAVNGMAAACDTIEAIFSKERSCVPYEGKPPSTSFGAQDARKVNANRVKIEAMMQKLSPAKRALLEQHLQMRGNTEDLS